jgi:hypothetical protein
MKTKMRDYTKLICWFCSGQFTEYIWIPTTGYFNKNGITEWKLYCPLCDKHISWSYGVKVKIDC